MLNRSTIGNLREGPFASPVPLGFYVPLAENDDR